MDVRGFVTVTIKKPDGTTQEFKQENSIDTLYIDALYKLITSGNIYNFTTPAAVFPTIDPPTGSDYQGTLADGYVAVASGATPPNWGMPMVKSGETQQINSATHDIWIPYVPRQITAEFVETNYYLIHDNPGNSTIFNNPDNWTDRTAGKKYRYVFGNTRVKFDTSNAWDAGSDGNDPRLSSISFIADGLTPSEADSNATAIGCALVGRNVNTGASGAPSANNRGGRHNYIMKIDAGTATANEVGIEGNGHFRIHEVGLITGYGLGANGDGSHDSFKTDPYRYWDRAGNRIAGSYGKPVYIGAVRDDNSAALSEGFPLQLSTYDWRYSHTAIPAANDQIKYTIDANDSVKFTYKIEISHSFNEHSTVPSGGGQTSEHDNHYSYRLLSAILKRPVGFPGEDNLDENNNLFRKSSYHANPQGGVANPLINPGGSTAPDTAIGNFFKQEYSMSEWQDVCHNVAINGFAVQHTHLTADAATVRSVANISTISGNSTASPGNICNYDTYLAGSNTFNRAKSVILDSSSTGNSQLGGNTDGLSAGIMKSADGGTVGNAGNSSFMFPATNHSLDPTHLMAGDSHFIYKGVGGVADKDNNSRPTWCVYFMDYVNGDTNVSGNKDSTVTNEPPDTGYGNLELRKGTVNLLVQGIDLTLGTALGTTSNQLNNFTSVGSTTWDTNTSNGNNLMMSHFLTISQTFGYTNIPNTDATSQDLWAKVPYA